LPTCRNESHFIQVQFSLQQLNSLTWNREERK